MSNSNQPRINQSVSHLNKEGMLSSKPRSLQQRLQLELKEIANLAFPDK
jgi:hypothetical protein